MKERTWCIRRGLSTYKVEATTRSKAKYEAYKEYKCRRKCPIPFFDWVVSVKYARLSK